MNYKKLILLTASFIAVIALSVGSTMAYFSYSQSVKNTFSLGNVKIYLTETDFKPSDALNLVPNSVVKKNPVVNIASGSQDCFVRVKVVISGIDAEKLDIDYNTGGSRTWVKLGDYYYYKTKLEDEKNKDKTTPLFTRVKIKDDVTEGADTSFDIDIIAEAIQSEGFNSATEAFNSLNS